MNRAKRISDPILLGLCILATLLGIVFIYDAGFPRAFAKGATFPPEAFSQLIFTAIAVIGFWVTSRISAERWVKLSGAIFAACFFLLLMVKLFGEENSGAVRWLELGFVRIQPSEPMKLAAILYLASVLGRRQDWPSSLDKIRGTAKWLDHALVPWIKRLTPGFLVIAAVVCIELEPDLGTAAVVASSVFFTMWVGGVSRRTLWMCVIVSVLGAGFMVLKEPYRMERFTHHNERWSTANSDDESYQTVQSELGAAMGGIWGSDFGGGVIKRRIPAPTNDYIMATIAEETGLVGAWSVLAILGGIVWRLFALAKRQVDVFRRCTLVGIASWIGIQGTTNYMMANSFIPSIGIPLPFFSSGGSSLVSLWLAIGISQAMIQPAYELKRISILTLLGLGGKKKAKRVTSKKVLKPSTGSDGPSLR